MFSAHPTRHILTFKACRRAIKFNDHLEQARDGERGSEDNGKPIWIQCVFFRSFLQFQK